MSTCPRVWSVEAARDGRLTGAEAETVARHVATCRACAEEARCLESLAKALGELPTREPDALSVRREKLRLLAAADASVVSRKRRSLPLFAAAAAAVAIAAGAVAVAVRAPDAAKQVAPEPFAATIDPAPHARFTHAREGKTETIALGEGSISLRIHRASPSDRVVVLVPDGIIEDEGTVFSVDVEDGHTEHLVVEEGAIAFRRGSDDVRMLRAGETWTREKDEARPAVVDATVDSTTAIAPEHSDDAAKPIASHPHRAATAKAPEARSRHEPTTPTSDEATTPRAPSDFQAGFRALREGRDREAADRLAPLSRDPSDEARAEDAAYLRIVALARSGAEEDARRAARSYLARFPHGFRRSEVEAIAR